MSDNSLEAMLDSAPTTEPVQAPAQQEPPPAETGVKEQDTAPPAEVESQQAPKEKFVPLKAVEDERRKRQELEKRIAEFEARFAQQKPQEQQPAPDWDLDPRSAAAHLAAEMQRRTFTMAVEMSERVVKQQHPDYEEVRNVFAEAAKADPRLAMELVNHPFPAEFAYQQGKRLRMLQEIGDDPDAYRQRLEAEIMAKMQGSQPAAPVQAPRQSAPVPKSLARAPSATQTRDQRGRFATDDGPTPLEDIIG